MVNVLDVVAIGAKLIDKLIPDPQAKAQAQIDLLKMQQAGQLEELKLSLSAILSDSQSADPWTSRARPTFLYVVYILILWSLPMGVMFVVNPDAASRFTEGFGLWLGSIPEPVLMLFGTVMLGYVGGRSWEKVNGAAK
jgi:hypothetical protein